MSDKPLFQNMDEQEAAYAPHQKAADDPTARRDTDEGDGGAPTGAVSTVAPIIAAGSLGGGGAQGSLGSTSSPAGIPAGAPALAGAALENDIRNNEEPRD